MFLSRDEFLDYTHKARKNGKSVVFTNGCFDILHRGHVDYLTEAANLGDVLLVGVNTDASVKRIKDVGRPVTCEADRAFMIAALKCVVAVCLFDDDTPLSLIRDVKPDVLVKGAEYDINEIIGNEDVLARGGSVVTVPMTPGISTTKIVQLIKGLPD